MLAGLSIEPVLPLPLRGRLAAYEPHEFVIEPPFCKEY